MVKINTVLRVMFSLVLFIMVALPAGAETVLTFPDVIQKAGLRTGFLVANPTEAVAEVDFSLYNLEGVLVRGIANPVRYRVRAHGSLSIFADEAFASTDLSGWVKLNSATPGLIGNLFQGDFQDSLDGSIGTEPFLDQIVPWLGAAGTAELRIINPSPEREFVSVVITNNRGNVVHSVSLNLKSNSVIQLFTSDLPQKAGENLSARITSSKGVVAQAVVEDGGSHVLVRGQPSNSSANFRVASHVMLGNGFDSTLVLANPSGQAVTVAARLLAKDGGPVHFSLSAIPELNVTIPANGSIELGATQLTGMVIAPRVTGWIEVRSPNVPLGSILLLEQGRNRTAYALQSATLGQVAYPKLTGDNGLISELALVNTASVTRLVSLAFIDVLGNTIAKSKLEIPDKSKQVTLLREIFPGIKPGTGGIVTLDAEDSIYGIELVGNETGGLLAATEAWKIALTESPVVLRPAIAEISPIVGRPGDKIRIRVEYFGDAGTAILGGQEVPARFLAPGMSIRILDIPEIDAGYVDLWLRSVDGVESERVKILILPNDGRILKSVPGRAFYEKVDVGKDGLKLTETVMVPIRKVRVDVVDRQTGQVISVSQTDDKGHFVAAVPEGLDYSLRVLSQLRSGDMVIADNTNGGAVFFVDALVNSKMTPVLYALESDRISGAFNILEVLRHGKAFVTGIEPDLEIPQLTVFWSPNNKRISGTLSAGEIGGTFFNVSNSTAYILGDRDTDSDEFDDAVILHEYAHLLALSFSSDDSSGGPHKLGDLLDPRVAWSEGWANFFSGVIRNDPVYRDSFGLKGARVLEYDLEENTPAGDQPGYRSEFSVHSILWDLFDNNVDSGDTVRLPFKLLWSAFRELDGRSFVYLPDFLERLVEVAPSSASMLERLALNRSIDFSSSSSPSVAKPFPRIYSKNLPVTGSLDSLSSQRANLAQSSHLYAIEFNQGSVSIRLDVTGLGPGQDRNANDLDLFLLNANGQVIQKSDRGLGGQSELISMLLPAGRYVVEVRSFYTDGETGTLVFNSGDYRLIVRVSSP